MVKLSVKKLNDDAIIPTRAHHDDAGVDLYACGVITVPPHTTVPVPTGVAMEIPSGSAGLIWDKSSVGARGIKTLGGVIDASYRGEVKVVVHNMNDTEVIFEHGQKIAQILIQKVELLAIEEVAELSDTVRGEGGFGSTGR